MGAIQPKVSEPVSDELALVEAAKAGDVSAFEELVRRYDRNVFRIAQCNGYVAVIELSVPSAKPQHDSYFLFSDPFAVAKSSASNSL